MKRDTVRPTALKPSRRLPVHRCAAHGNTLAEGLSLGTGPVASSLCEGIGFVEMKTKPERSKAVGHLFSGAGRRAHA